MSDGFWRSYGSRVAIDFLGVAVKLPDGADGFDRLANATAQLSGGRFTASLGDNFVPNRAALVRTIDLQATALLAVGLLGALAGAVLVAQVIVRQVASRSEDHRILATLGMTRRQIIASEVLAVLPAAIGGAVVAAVVAVAFSPLTPVGVARDAELRPGVDVNWFVVSAGAAAVVAFVAAVTCRRGVGQWSRSRRTDAAPIVAQFMAGGGGCAARRWSLAATSRCVGRAERREPCGSRSWPLPSASLWSSARGSSVRSLDQTARHTRRSGMGLGRGGRRHHDPATGRRPAAAALNSDPDVAGYAGELGGIYVPIDGRPTPVTVLDVHGDRRAADRARRPRSVGGRRDRPRPTDAATPCTSVSAISSAVASPQGQVLQLRVVGAIVPMSAVDSAGVVRRRSTGPLRHRTSARRVRISPSSLPTTWSPFDPASTAPRR